MEWFRVGWAATFVYVTFFVMLIPFELAILYYNAYQLVYGTWTVPLISFGIMILYGCYVFVTRNAPFNGKGAPLYVLLDNGNYG